MNPFATPPGKTIVIAEAGVNHNGSLELARKMVDAAAEAGADYVKFQTAVPELVISSVAPKAEYQKATTGNDESQLEMCKAIHLPLSDYRGLRDLCLSRGIGFISTPFDLTSIDLLANLDMDFFKIPSGEITNLPYLRRIASKGIPVILSTGMALPEEIVTAIEILTGESKKYPSVSTLTRNDIITLHCTTEYPAPYSEINLRAMQELALLTGTRTGYSDHSVGIEVSVAAAALGACVVEKHFTLDRSLPGPDHKASIEPDELAQLVKSVRHVNEALGCSRKIVTPSEAANIPVARKSIVAARDIRKGEVFTEENITMKRPGSGISPMLWDTVIGKISDRDFPYDHLIEIEGF